MSFEELVELERAAAELLLETLRSVSRPDDLGGGFMPELEEVEEQEEAEELEEEEVEKEPEKGPPLEANAPVVPGWIVRKKVPKVKLEKDVEGEEFNWANEDFSPLLPEMEQEYLLPFASFHRCVDEFFTQLEENKVGVVRHQLRTNVYAYIYHLII